MSVFPLPSVIRTLDDNNFLLTFHSLDDIRPKINYSLFRYLHKTKVLIENYLNQWDVMKKYTNQYEYIHTVIPNTKNSVCKYNPISRSFFKLIEIIQTHNLFDNMPTNLNSFHLAEGPGGFIEAIATQRNNVNDNYYGMTLIDPTNSNIPGWKKSEKFLAKFKNVHIEKGIDNTGNLYSAENLEYCYKKYANSMDIITGDGGFDFSIDFNKQEALSIRLIFSQIVFAICMQKKGGCFILKIFDFFLESTIDLIYLLSSVYETVEISKPSTSRTANSEKYIICKGFKYIKSEKPYRKFYEIFSMLSRIDLSKNYISKFFKFNIPYYYINRIEECNAILGQQQMENINFTITMIDNKKKTERIEQIKKAHTQKCIAWCVKHNMPYNKNSVSTNIFLQDSSSNTNHFNDNDGQTKDIKS